MASLNSPDLSHKVSASHARAGCALPVVGAVLAAGLGRRMLGRNKLLEQIDGVPMVRRAAEQVLASRCSRVLVVLGHEAGRVREALVGLPVRFVDNPGYQEGMAASVRVAAASVVAGEALLVCLGDMPRVDTAVLDTLIDAYQQYPDKAVYQPEYAGRRGNPVLWAPGSVAWLDKLQGDEGARSLLRTYAQDVMPVPVQHGGIFLDVDTPEALNTVRASVDAASKG